MMATQAPSNAPFKAPSKANSKATSEATLKLAPSSANAAAAPTLPLSSTSQAVTRRLGLSQPLSQWLNNTFQEVEKTQSAAALAQKSAAKSFTPCIFYVLTDEGDLCALKGRRRPHGRDCELTGDWASSSWLNSTRERPAYADAQDCSALLLIYGAKDINTANLRARLSGVGGAQLLNLAYETGRLFSLPATQLRRALKKRPAVEDCRLTKPLVIAPSRVAHLIWQAKGSGDAALISLAAQCNALAAQCDATPLILIPTSPAYGLDIATQQLIPIASSASTATIERLALLPPLRRDDAVAWTFVSDALAALPDAASIPPLPATIHAQPLPIPTPPGGRTWRRRHARRSGRAPVP